MPEERDEELDALPPGTRTRSAGVILAAIALLFVISWLLSGGGSEFFRSKIQLHIFLSDTGGLSKGADVLLNGVQAGKVANVFLTKTTDPNRAIQVDLRVEKSLQDRIPVDSIAALTADNLLGDKFVNIQAGKASQTVVDGAEIASLIQSGSFNPADLVSSLQATLQRVDLIISQIQQGDTPLAQFVNGNDFYSKLLSQVEAVQLAIQSVAGPKTQMGQMLFSDAFYNSVRQPILNIDHMLEQLQRGETPAGKLLTSPAVYDNAVAQIRNVHRSVADLNSNQGSAAALLHSDAQYRKLQAQIRGIDQAIDRLTAGNGQFAQLLQSRQLYDSVDLQSKKSEAFLRDFRQDPRKFLRIKPFGSKHPKKP